MPGHLRRYAYPAWALGFGPFEFFDRTPSGYSVIHADMHPGNIVVDGDRLTVIDFDDAGFGWHQYDIATALTHW